MIGEAIVTPLLQKIGEVLNPLVVQLQKEAALKDIHTIAVNSEKIARVFEELHKVPAAAPDDAFIHPLDPPLTTYLFLL